MFEEGSESQIFKFPMDGPVIGFKIYGYAMQSEYGDVKDPKPSSFDIIGGLLWQSWKDLEGKSKTDA